jgi:ABC-type sugar transport system permease subunit
METSIKLSTPVKNRYSKLQATQRRFAYLVLIVPMVVLFTFILLPTILAGYYSFTDFNMITAPVFIGLRNFKDLFADPIFIHALKNTTIYMFGCVIMQVIVGLSLAMVVTREWLKGKTFFRTIYFLPVVLSMVAVAIVFQWVFDSRVGLVNLVLNYIGIAPQPWLTSVKQALLTVIIISIWKFSGYNVIIFTAAIQSVPIEYYEAASVDGSNGWTDFRYITLPLIQPSIVFSVITGAIGSFQVFDSVYVITQAMGGPNFSTMTLLVYLYKHAFDGMRFGYGSAVSIIMFVILLVLTLLQLKIGRGSEAVNA